MALQKYVSADNAPSVSVKLSSFCNKVQGNAQHATSEACCKKKADDVDIDLREVYFLIMHFLSAGPCQRTYGQFWNELLEHHLLPRRYHAWYSRNGAKTGHEDDDGSSFPLSYSNLLERYPHIEKNHLVKLLKQLLLNAASPSQGLTDQKTLNAYDVPTLLGTGSFSLLSDDREKGNIEAECPPPHMRWPHRHADQVRGLSLREIGGGFTRHHRAPSVRAACYAIAKPSTMVQKMQNLKRLRGHRNAVYCAIFDRLGRYVITGSDDRLVKIWSMETAFCLASCRGHEGDITDLAVSSNNALVASASNDCIIRVWRLPDGLPISVLRGHTGAVTAIAFSPRPGSVYQLLSSSDDGTCRIWDARNSNFSPRTYVPRPSDSIAGKNTGPSSSNAPPAHQIFCCAFNANGTVFVTGSSDNLARVWNACKPNTDDSDQPNHEIDVLSGHENDVNYVQFSGCAVPSRFSPSDSSKEESVLKFKNSWFSHDNIVTCSRDGSAIIWIPRPRRSHGKHGRWTRAYHLKVPPPPMPPQPPRGGPRQRILPTPRGVNMIIWSLDNRFVLAAIMDCRICVWNAADGSIVHSLTGHTASTYVLDVHPFNPRIAMSAGYDGRTIVWDIWEGKPIRTYEISRFKLVDGKFSPDGTSIILSDDVGQLYILSTGQGESQDDAKYDQFFLGDYRPMIQDAHGIIVDQETQLIPYRRNMQDLLCDSGMNPYLEPYQSMFQKRRLGALGLEWKPSTLWLSVGPDFSVDPDYQIFLADLDILIEPLPEFMDAMDWEPENEVVRSDDTDSEYNGAEEYSTGEEQGSANSLSSCDPDSSAEESEIQGRDGFRRSKRKKQKAEMEIMTSSGRRVKRRNLDECDGNSFRMSRKKSRSTRKNSKKSSTSKALRPQRAAARNTLTLFSKITGRPTDGDDEDGSEGDSSESDSMMQYSDSESVESLGTDRSRNLKGKEVIHEESEDFVQSNELDASNMHSESRKRLVLKLPIRGFNRNLLPESSIHECDNQADLDGALPRSGNEANKIHGSSSDQGSLFGNANGGIVERKEKEEIEFGHLDLKGCINGDIRWGGVKARTSKRQKLGDAMSSVSRPVQFPDDYNLNENDLNGIMKDKGDNCLTPPSLEVGKCANKIVESVLMNGTQFKGDANKVNHVTNDKESEKQPSLNELPKLAQMANGEEDLPELKESLEPISTKLRLETVLRDSVEKQGNEKSGETEDAQQNPVLKVSEHDQTSRVSPDCKVNGQRELDSQIDKVSEPVLSESMPSESHSHPKKMFDNVYRRSKSSKDRANTQRDVTKIILSNHDVSASGELHERVTDGACGGHSSAFEVPKDDPNTGNDGINTGKLYDSDEIPRHAENDLPSKCQLPCEEWGPSSSKMTVGLRSTRNRRMSYHFRDISPVNRRKSYQSSKKESWLMLSMHEGGSHYIPQLGDEVAYLRQGHQEYIIRSSSKEAGPWRLAKGNIRAVEFCKVEGLEYSTLPGSGDGCCKLTLKFVDPTSAMFGKLFKLTLPEITGFPDFLVERSRFEAAMQRNWTHRDKCRVWWKNEGEEDGSWWTGRIVNFKAKSPEFPDSPWERFTVQYKNDPSEKYPHSPWELFDADTQWEQPCIEEETRNKLLSAFYKLEKTGKKDYYGVEKLMQVSDKSYFTNRFPVPLSFQVIHSRLENNYYRTVEAVKHDIEVMLSNAESYFAKNAEISAKMRRLSDYFKRTSSSL